MQNKAKTRRQVEQLALLALLTAMVAVLAYFGGFIKIGGLASISLTLIPVVIGAALCGPWAGAWLGAVAGAIFFATADAAFWFSLNVPGTIVTVLIKGAVSGLCAGYAYKLLENVNQYLAVIVSAIVCPVVNTSIFLLGCRLFFFDTVQSGAAGEGMSVFAYMIVFFVGLNFVFELLANIVLSPTILRILNIGRKQPPKPSDFE